MVVNNRVAALPDLAMPVLPRGNGRSYGDSCQNNGGALLLSRKLDRFISFDRETGVLRCEAGVLFSEIIALTLAHGWFLPVTPGTQFVTVGGAIANDVHGKNHHVSGTFGRHVSCFELLRSDGQRLLCSPESNAELFAATIGGLGLTGLISWAEIQLKPVASAYLDHESVKYHSLTDFFRLSEECYHSHEYTVAWVDCSATGSQLGRGLFSRANHSPAPAVGDRLVNEGKLNFPLELPFSLVNPLSVRAFNALYYHKQWRAEQQSRDHYRPFFYPLDGIQNWNRMYGKRGFLQFQCVVPMADAESAVADMLQVIGKSGAGSFLVVLKVCGDIPSPGLLSFPRHGASLALDFPIRGKPTFELLAKLEHIVSEANGALYPAKDACMSSVAFKTSYPRWQEFEQFMDPGMGSDFWRRVVGSGSSSSPASYSEEGAQS